MPRLVDETTGAMLAERVELALSPWARFRGLMLRKELPAGSGLLIRPCSSIHMGFMRFAIDAVFVDREGRVTKVARTVRPWIGIAFGGRGAHAVYELPRGAAEGVERGHTVRLIDDDDEGASS